MEKFLQAGFVFVSILYTVQKVEASCNEAVCASLVSKCLLLRSCECDMTDKKNCTCCKQCQKCLSKLYTDCCSCVGMCPERHDGNSGHKTSTVEVIDDPIPDLFNVLTEDKDEDMRWTTFTYPAHLDLLYFKPKGDSDQIVFASNAENKNTKDHQISHGGHKVFLDPNSNGINCTVAYMSDCLPLHKCKASCQSMGAARYRWFHQHGCCECIGSTCLDFGKGEALCHQCPKRTNEEEDDDYYDVILDEDDDEEEEFEHHIETDSDGNELHMLLKKEETVDAEEAHHHSFL